MKRILIAYDGGATGLRAIELAADLALAFDARVDVVSVVPEGFGSAGRGTDDPAFVHARALVEASALLRDRGLSAGLIEPSGEPATTIERLAAEGDYDTVVVGESRVALKDAGAPGTVAAHVATHARATVVVAR